MVASRLKTREIQLELYYDYYTKNINGGCNLSVHEAFSFGWGWKKAQYKRKGAYHVIKEHIGIPEFSRSLLFTEILFCRTYLYLKLTIV